MKIKKIFMSCLLLAGVLSASAQEQYPKTVYDHNPYWYIQVQGGAQYTLGEIDFKDLVSPNVQVAFGRQFTPVFGARLAVNAWQSKAGIEDYGQVAKWKWKYVAPGIDLTFNLSNLFCGFNPNRIFNFSVFGGLGANIGWDNKAVEIANVYTTLYPKTGDQNLAYVWDGTKVRMFGRAGVAADFKVSEAVSLGLEVNANTLSDRYNSKKAGNWDWYFNALAGVKINLGKTYSTRTIEAPKVPEKVIEKVIERVVEKPCPQQQIIEPTRAVAQKKEDKFRRDVFFMINGTQISKKEQAKVQEIAEYMKANPNSKVEITGYADRGTGNATINRNLSQRRAQAVSNMLQRTYKIKKDRIKTDFKGDTIQPFATDVENRVSICIAE
jgi:outer membrane protein OmpA-like peptidoglycan-associated protein